MKKSYRNIILPKIILLTVLLVVSIQLTYSEFLLSEFSLSFIVSLFVSIFLLMKNSQAITLYNKIGNNSWKVNLYELGNKFYYSAFISKKEQYEPFLNEVFK